MTRLHTILSLATLCLPFSLSAMNYTEIPLTPLYKKQKNIATDDAISSVDVAINKKHGTNNLISDSLAPFFLSEEKMLDIIATIKECYPTLIPTDELINELYNKNNYFKKAIDYFNSAASNNLHNVTCSTLSLIEQPELPQPTIKLNKLSLPIKTYLIKKALNQIEHSYEIQLTGHTDTIWSFDISAHLAATGSADQTTRIWDLNTGKQTHILQNKGAHIIRFNPDGSRLATIEWYQSPEKTIIKEWNILSGGLIWSMDYKESVYNLEYVENTSNKILTITTEDKYRLGKSIQTLLLLNENKPCPLGTIPSKQIKNPFYESKYTKNYHADHPAKQLTNTTTLYVTKNNCQPLYLCQQAIKNTPTWNTPACESVKQSQSYKSLTDYEKKLIQAHITQKSTALKEAKATLKHSKKLLTLAGI